MFSIRPMLEEELEGVYARVARDFPPIEYPPLRKMKGHVAQQAVEGHLYQEGDRQGAYAFVLRAPTTPRALLLLYAVEPELRAQGMGSSFLGDLAVQYAGAAGLYAEVEKEELALDDEQRRICRRRIAFYERLGFVRVVGLFYSIYGVEMHLYYKPLAQKNIPDAQQAIEDVTALYHHILRPNERHNLDARVMED